MFTFFIILYIYLFVIFCSLLAVSIFSEERISKNVLKKMIQFPGLVEEWDCDGEEGQNTKYLYKKGFNCDYFILIIEGRVEVTVGSEDILFEDGPFSVFGTFALTREKNEFTPDYTVKLASKVQFLRINRSIYKSALRATKLERQNKTPDNFQEHDEIFFSEAKNLRSPAPADTLSSTSYDSERSGTPTKQNTKRNHMNNLLRRLTPKYDRCKDSKDFKDDASKSLSIGSGQENPLMTNDEADSHSYLESSIDQQSMLDRTTDDTVV